MCLWSQETESNLKPWSVHSGSLSGPQCSPFSFIIHLAPLFSFLFHWVWTMMHTRQKLMQLLEKFYDPGESRRSSHGSDPVAATFMLLVSGWKGEMGFILPGRLLPLTNCTPTHKCHSTDVSGLLPSPRHKIPLSRLDERPTVGEKSGLMEVHLIMTSSVWGGAVDLHWLGALLIG